MKVLNVKIDQLTKREALSKVEEFLCSNTTHKIFTPNPEMLVDAHNDIHFKEVLNDGHLNLCDGRGIQLVAKGKVERIPGVDFMLDTCKLAEQLGKSVYFLGSGDSQILAKLREKITTKFKKIKIVGSHPGHDIIIKKLNDRMVIDLDEVENNELISDIVMANPDILFVAFGHGKQEKWIDEYLPDLPGIKVVMGVGGSFDFIAGKVKRAPRWMRKIGLEWLYRLIKQPKRIKRIWKATVVFLWLNLKNRP